MPRHAPTDADHVAAVGHLVDGLLAGHDALEIARTVIELHPKNDTFPGGLSIRIGADALQAANATADAPIPMDGLRSGYRCGGQMSRGTSSAVVP